MGIQLTLGTRVAASVRFAVCLVLILGASSVFSQDSISAPDSALSASSTPVAFVYVSHGTAGNANQISGYAAAANGKLTPIAGSPFKASVTSMVTNGKYLFASTKSGIYVAAFSIESNGALRWERSTDVVHGCSTSPGGSGPLVLDRTGSSLYDLYWNGEECSYDDYQSFSIDKSTAGLTYLGGNEEVFCGSPLSFMANNVFAYGAICDPYSPPPGVTIQLYGFRRNSNGALSYLNTTPPLPKAEAGFGYCPFLTAADNANHLAVFLQPYKVEDLNVPTQLATYTVDAHGNLTTASTSSNMPTTLINNVYDMKMSPSGKLLAVGGVEGLQVFHFNGASPATHYTGLLNNVLITQFFWDNDNHLYAISPSAGKLFVYTVAPSSVSQAPGSPYNITSPQNVIVQTLSVLVQ
jgi:hypothetical protein